MATEVKLPDLGEGVEDASISRWLVKAGDAVNAGDVILEVATDKVDTEVTAPTSGTILKLNAGEGEIVSLTSVLALIGAAGESIDDAPAEAAAPVAEPAAEPAVEQAAESDPGAAASADAGTEPSGAKATPVAKRVAADKGVALSDLSGTGPGGQITKEDVLTQVDGAQATGTANNQSALPEGRSSALPDEFADISPLEVRRLAATHNINLTTVAAGRALNTLTRYDVLNAIAARDGTDGPTTTYLPPAEYARASEQPTTAVAPSGTGSATTTAPSSSTPPAPSAPSAPAPKLSEAMELVKPTRMRQLIAQNTFASLQSSPQLTTWHDVDMTAVIQHRKAHKAEFAANGVNLTVTAYLIAATIAGLKAVPAANARWTDDGIAIYHTYNIGMAAAMPADKYGLGGLIVPVIKNAGDLNLMGVARQVNELAQKARANQISGPDLQDGTFTVTNYGTSGSVFQTPIIHQGQAGILGTGAIEKRAVVVSNGSPLEANLGDYLSFKPMMTLAFTFDHRVLDGATADAFCVAIKQTLEGWG